MEKITKFGIGIIAAFILIVCTAAVVAYFVGRAHPAAGGRAGRELEAAADLNRAIAGEQQFAVGEVRYSREQLEASLGSLAEIRRITQETNSSLGELGGLNRRSGDISTQIRTEANLLANYLRGVSNILGDIPDPMGSE